MGRPQPTSTWRHLLDDELLANGLLGLINEVGTRWPRLQPRINQLAGQALSPRTFVDHSAAVFVSPRRVRFVESEYAIPRSSLVPVITELRRWIDATTSGSASRWRSGTAAADDLWLSTGYQRENAYVAVHHYWRKDPTRFFAAFEAIVAEHGGRPHWGKMHTLGVDRLRELYPAARRLPGCPGPARSGPGVRERVPRPGAGFLSSMRAGRAPRHRPSESVDDQPTLTIRPSGGGEMGLFVSK